MVGRCGFLLQRLQEHAHTQRGQQFHELPEAHESWVALDFRYACLVETDARPERRLRQPAALAQRAQVVGQLCGGLQQQVLHHATICPLRHNLNTCLLRHF
jgi:predicted nucleic acid-binding Zn ribbon protein